LRDKCFPKVIDKGEVGCAEHPRSASSSEVQVTDDLHLVALTDDDYEPVMLVVNHSCEPNVGFAGNVVPVAMRDIEAARS
jgi:uncharacterized protein